MTLTLTLLLPATLLPNGRVQLGGVEAPAWVARDCGLSAEKAL